MREDIAADHAEWEILIAALPVALSTCSSCE
jgi:hypothetical protein